MSDTLVISLMMCMCYVFAVCFGMVVFRKKICEKIPKFPILCKIGSKGGSSNNNNNNPAPGPATGSMPQASDLASDSMKWGGTLPKVGSRVGNVMQTFYSRDNNTPAGTNTSASGELMIPYVSCALPFSFFTKKSGGPYDYGDWFEIDSLRGKKLPNGKTHTGFLKAVTYCGDFNDYTYCIKDHNGKKYSSIDVYIGPFKTSGQKCDGKGTTTGPAGSGLTFTGVKYWGKNPPKDKALTSYGLPETVPGLVCNDVVGACMATTGLSREVCAAEVARVGPSNKVNRMAQGPVQQACFAYIPQFDDEAYGWCFSAQNASGEGKKNGGL
jgi:hypothetical protein